MLELFGTIANDKINRYNERLTTGAIIDAYQRQWADIIPMTVNHDSTKLIGFSRFFSVFIKDGTTFLTNQTFVPENEKEQKHLDLCCRKKIIDNIVDENREQQEKLLELVGDNLSGKPKMYFTDSVAVVDNGIVERCLPHLWVKRDNDGLIPLKELTPVSPGIYKCEEYLVYAHSYFRRTLSRLNRLNIPFLMRLQTLNIDAKIALDPDMLGLPGTETSWREYSYWWGPKFDDDLNKIPIGVTRYENEHYNSLSSPVLRTECGWYIQNGIRTFECEEITDIKNIAEGSNTYGCRYVHSMMYPEVESPHHLDGAIRAYDDEKMIKRLECNMDKASKDTAYTKLWRVDGSIDVTIWKELITHYYRDNPLVGEYFCDEKYGDEFQDDKQQKSEKNEEISILDFLPTTINSGEGICLQISIDKREELPSNCSIFAKPSTYNVNEDSYSAIEYDTITLSKIIEEKSQKVTLGTKTFLTFNDLVINFPVFLCESSDEATIVAESVFGLCNIWSNKNDNRIVSFSVKINYKVYAITFSFLGHVDDLSDFSNKMTSVLFPQDSSDLVSWGEKTRELLETSFSGQEKFEPQRILNKDGYLYYNRKFVPEECIEGYINESDGTFAKLNLPSAIMQWIKNNETITATSVYLVNSCKCNKCGKNYMECGCKKFIDEEVSDNLSATELGVFWTDRMA